MLSRIKNISITTKITLWYSLFITVIVAVIIAISVFVADEILSDLTQQNLVKSVDETASGKEDFEAFDDGIFFIKYQNGSVIDGFLPKGFNASLPLLKHRIGEYERKDFKFYYYDSPVDDSTWIRGVLANSGMIANLGWFLLALCTLTPLLLGFVIFGGYRLIKSSLAPVNTMSQTAVQISRNKDFSKRIDVKGGKDELHKLADLLNLMLDSLERAYKSEKQLTSDISHELRTPVSIVLAQSDYALEYAQNFNEAKESLEVINKHAKRLSGLIGQILEFSRLENTQDIPLKKLNLSEILTDAAKDYERLAKEKSLNLSYKITPDIKILGDEIMINRLIDNLLNNALKFTKTKVIIELTKSKSSAVLKVIDDGAGIKEDEKELVWSKFYQSNESRNKSSSEGNGLGLAMAANIAKIHGARVSLKSAQDKGSEFSVEFELFKA